MINKKITVIVLLLLAMAMVICSCSVINDDGNGGKDKPVEQSGTYTQLKVEDIYSETNAEAFAAIMESYVDTENFAQNNPIKAEDEVEVIILLDNDSIVKRFNEQSEYDSVVEYLSSANGSVAVEKMLDAQDKVLAKVEEKGIELGFMYNYTTLLNGIAATVKYGDISVLEATDGIDSVVLSETFLAPETTPALASFMQGTGILVNDSEYKGENTIVAIVDTGLNYNHTAFSKELTQTAYSQEQMNDVIDLLSAKGVWYNSKVAYGYDYADNDSNVYPTESHGTHVAGIVAGDDDTITGVTPNAQLAIFKVFSDASGGASTLSIIRALGDAVIMGVDVINMSVGTPCGFSYERGDDYQFINDVYSLIERTGISLCCSAGNTYNTGLQSSHNGTLTSNPDNGTISSPGSYDAAFAVASVESVAQPYMHFQDGIDVFFNDAVDANRQSYNFYSALVKEEANKTFEYVLVPNFGNPEDYANINVEGKIALVIRGGISFELKQQYAAEHGAIGCIVFNNTAGEINMQILNLMIPSVSIKMDAGMKLAANEQGTFVMGEDYRLELMSDFSSWGPLSDLTIKPEITAPGGSIYSSVIEGYDAIDGTSMSSPAIAGVVSLVRQYLETSNAGFTQKQMQDMAYRLIMSTATMVYDKGFNPALIRKQGAGMANIDAAIATKAFLSVTGSNKTKLELGDDKGKDGVYTLNFNLVNFGDEQLSYYLNTITMTDAAEGGLLSGLSYMLNKGNVSVSVAGGDYVDGKVTVGAGNTAKIKVVVELADEEKAYLDETFENGMYVEGFVKLTSDSDQPELSIPWLAFYGDWNTVPAFDEDIYSDSIYSMYPVTPLGLYGNSLIPMGQFPYATPDGSTYAPDIKKMSLSTINQTLNELNSVYLGLMRNVDRLEYSLTDKYTGDLIWSAYAENVSKSYFNTTSGNVSISGHNLEINPFVLSLYANQEVNLNLAAYIGDSEQPVEVLTYSIFIDMEAPTLLGCTLYELDDQKALNLTVFENNYLMDIQLLTSNGAGGYKSLSDYAIPVTGDIAGETTNMSVDITDLWDNIVDNVLVVYVEDYAFNAGAFVVSFGEGGGDSGETETPVSDGLVIQDGILLEYTGTDSEVVLPDTVTSIGVAAFTNAKDFLTSVVINEGCKEINDRAFMQCAKLSKVVLPESLEKLGNMVFHSCTSLKYVSVSSNITSLGNAVWYGCTSLKSISFWYTDLASVTMGGGLFINVPATTPIYVPAGTYDAYYTLPQFTPFKALVVDMGTLFDMEGTVITSYKGEKADVILPAGVTAIKENAFKDNTTINTISAYDLKEIGASAFENSSLKSIEFFENELTSIGDNAFKGCTELNELTIINENPPAIGNNVFDGVKEGFKVNIPAGAMDAYEENENWAQYKDMLFELEFKIVNGVLVEYRGKGGDVVLPAGFSVIGSKVFYGNNTITSVDMSQSEVVDIGQEAFMNCMNCTSIILPPNVETIRLRAFLGCAMDKMIFPESVKTFENQVLFLNPNLVAVDIFSVDAVIGYGMFVQADPSLTIWVPDAAFDYYYNMPSMSISQKMLRSMAGYEINGEVLESYTGTEESISFPASVTVVGEGAFENNASMKSVTLKGITDIRANAFKNVSGLTVITILDNIKYIGDGAFANCGNLVDATFNSKVPCEIGMNVFDNAAENFTIFVPSGTKADYLAYSNWNTYADSIVEIEFEIENGVLLSYSGNGGKVVIPDKVTQIGDKAFFDNNKITHVVFPEGLTSIGESAFDGCTSLKELVLPSNVISIGAYAFNNCAKITNIQFNDGLQEIGDSAFSNCNSIKSITIPSSVRSVGEASFFGCVSLKDVVFETGFLTTIAKSMFYNCTALTNVTLPQTLKVIGFGAFQSSSLRALRIPASVTTIEGQAFVYSNLELITMDGITPPTATTFTFFCYGYRTLKVYVPAEAYDAYIESWKNYGDKFISDFSTLVYSMEDFVVEDGVLTAYNGTNGFITFPMTITAIGEETFKGNEGIGRISTYGGLKEIRAGAFENCTSLHYFELQEVEVIGERAFAGCTDLKTVTMPESIKEIGANAFKGSALESITLTNKMPPKLGAGAFDDVAEGFVISIPEGTKDAYLADEVWATYASHINEVSNFVIIDNVLYAYYGEEVDIVIPDGVIAIAGGFKDNTNIKSVIVPEGVTMIREKAFVNCSSLEKVVLPQSLVEIGDEAFSNCTALHDVDLGGVKLLKNFVFSNCTSLKNIVLPDTLESMWGGVFLSTGLVEIELPSSLTMVFANTFGHCPYLQKITIHGNGISFENVFVNLPSLTELYIDGYVENIGGVEGKDFAAFDKLTNVVIDGDIGSISGYAFAASEVLESITFNGNIGSINYKSFNSCKKLSEVVFNGNVGNIDASAFNNSHELKSFTVGENNPYLASDEYNVLYNKDYTRVYRQPDGWDYEGTYVMPDSVITMDEYAFSCGRQLLITLFYTNVAFLYHTSGYVSPKTLLTGVELSENLTYVPDGAFYNAENLSEINLDNIEEIGAEAFSRTSIKEVVLGNNVKSIGSRAFANSDIRKITISANTCDFDYSEVFKDCANISSLIIEEGNPNFVVENGVVFNADKTVLYLYSANIQNTEYVVPEGVLKISAYAFKGNAYITKVTLPESLKVIGHMAFYNTDALLTYVFLGQEAPNLECILNPEYQYWYANFNDYVTELTAELTIYHPINGTHYYNLIWSSIFAVRYEVNPDGTIVEPNEEGNETPDAYIPSKREEY